MDASKYADNLKQSLIKDFFEGDETEGAIGETEEDYGIGDMEYENELTLQDIEKELEEFQEHEAIKAILEQGRILKEYARDNEDKLRQVELESIQDYIQESDNLVGLHEQIKSCDGILEHMEETLGKFQSDLGKVSEEIRQLQVQSQTMSTKLKNRRAAESTLGSFIDQLVVSEYLVSSIMDNEVSEDYLECLLALDKKLKFVCADEVAKGSHARRDVEPSLERLRIKALAKVRDFILQKVYTLKRPKTNIQIIQQNVLLKYKYFVRFLREHGDDIYTEVQSEYVGVLSKILSQHFRTYLASMEKMQSALASQTDLLGAPDAGIGGVNVLAMFSKQAKSNSQIEHVFELGDRSSILEQVDRPAMIPHMAEYEGKKFPYEVIFRNVHKLLMDTATSEFLFCLDFFEREEVFKELFGPVVAVVEYDLTTAVQELWDIISVMLMIRINYDHRKIMIKRRVPCLDDYLDRVHLLLWPRFKVLFDHQMNSIKAGSERTLFNNEAVVHYVVRRYAALTASMLTLMADHEQDEQGIFKASGFGDMMDRLWASMFDLLLRMSNLFKDRRMGIIFLIVNYNHILNVLKTADAQIAQNKGTASSGGLGKHGAIAIKEYEEQLGNCTSMYVEDQLQMYFRDLLDFVKKAEQTQKRLAIPEGSPIPGFTPAHAAPVLRDFGARWTSAIEAMHREVSKQFVETTCGRDVLQASMTQLLKYYTRILELLKKQGPEGLSLAKDAVNIPSIMYEIKRITKT